MWWEHDITIDYKVIYYDCFINWFNIMLKEVLILGLVVCVLQKDIIYVKGRVVQNGHGYLSDEEYRKVMKVIEKYNKMNLGSGLKMNVYRISKWEY